MVLIQSGNSKKMLYYVSYFHIFRTRENLHYFLLWLGTTLTVQLINWSTQPTAH